MGVGLTGILLSWCYLEPIITAWSTLACLVTAVAATPYPEAVGA